MMTVAPFNGKIFCPVLALINCPVNWKLGGGVVVKTRFELIAPDTVKVTVVELKPVALPVIVYSPVGTEA
jgi:hypothetical protein